MKNLNLPIYGMALCTALISSNYTQAQDERGDLYLVDIEYVTPDNVDQYEQWGKEFKALADKTQFKNFFTSQDNEAFYYIWNIGKDKAGLDTHSETWKAWSDANPEVDAMYEKYKNTMTHRKRELWRHSIKYSYSPESYKSDQDNTYTRFFFGYVKVGQGKAIGELLQKYKDTWTEKGISNPYNVYWNVFGLEQNCMLVVQSFKSRQAWLDARAQVVEKVGEEQLKNWDKEWNKLLRKMEDKEGTPRYDLSHFNKSE